ncbi:DNA adenine methylase [Brevibacillus sp. NPDC058079]|uniref:DNA adenine methylase n=1 Tax=Brevibacillus sp. NPDC058079 TaxID=3346330 RepID=UPI0036EF1466
MPDQWSKVPDRILSVTDRLKRVQIEQQPALQLIERYKNPSVLIYVDPPYLLSTRSKRLYKKEMTDADHIKLLDALDEHPGPVILSGYDNDLYNICLKHWRKWVASEQKLSGSIQWQLIKWGSRQSSRCLAYSG